MWFYFKTKLFSNAAYAAKLPKKSLEILLLLYNLYILASDQKKVLFSRAAFDKTSSQKAIFNWFLSNFEATF